VAAVLNSALDHPCQTASIILSNGFYAPIAGTGPPALTTTFALGQYPNTAPLGPVPAGTAHGLHSLTNGLSHDPVSSMICSLGRSRRSSPALQLPASTRLASFSSSSPNPAHSGHFAR
jgi:hypothetical protein